MHRAGQEHSIVLPEMGLLANCQPIQSCFEYENSNRSISLKLLNETSDTIVIMPLDHLLHIKSQKCC